MTTVFEKPFAKNNFINFRSNHPRYCFSGIVTSQVFRLIMICKNEEDFKFQKAKLFKKLLEKDFPGALIRKTKKPSFCLRLACLNRTITNREIKIRNLLNSSNSTTNLQPIRFVKRFEKSFNIERHVHTFLSSVWEWLPEEIKQRSFIITNKVKKKTYRITKTKSILKPDL